MAKKKTAKTTTKKTARKDTKAVKKSSKRKSTSNKASKPKVSVKETVPKAPIKKKDSTKSPILIVLAIILVIAAIFAYSAYKPLPIGAESKTAVAQAKALDISMLTSGNDFTITVTETGETIYVTEEDITYLNDLFRTNGYEAQQSELIQEAVVRNILLENAQDITVNESLIENLNQNQVFVQRVESIGFTVDEFITKYGDELQKDLRIQEYFNQRIASNVPTAKTYETSHILICYQGAQSCTENRSESEAREIAENVLLDVRDQNTQEYFAQVATSTSDGPSSSNGGYLGPVTPGVMIPEFEEVTFALEVGEISDLVQTQFGFHIIRVSNISETPNQQETVAALTELREKIVTKAQATTIEG